MSNINPKILVIGAGISGIHSAIELAESGYQVCLVDKSPAFGGILPKLDHQFPNDHCGMCRMLPMVDRDSNAHSCLKRGLFHENIDIRLSSEISSVQGTAGQFKAVISEFSPGIDKDKCTGCGECEKVCPETASDNFNEASGGRKAVFLPTPVQMPPVYVIDWDTCTRCNACVEACKYDAISIKDNPEPKTNEIEAAAIVIATGSRLYKPEIPNVYGFGELPNVVTATGFERILSSTGPVSGKNVRPSDNKPIKKVAWIQCVGSRNLMIGADYCSSACCMFAVKEAVLAKNKLGHDADTAIFYMDMRTFGRDFQRYRDAAEKEKGVRFVRCRLHSVEPAETNNDLKISYVNENNESVSEVFDMVVLSTGQSSENKLPDFAKNMEDTPGIFVVDSAQGLKDISESLISAQAAAGSISLLTGPPLKRDPENNNEQYAKNFTARPKIAVIQYNNFKHGEHEIDWEKVEETICAQPSPPDFFQIKESGSKSWKEIEKIITDGKYNRLVLAVCSPDNLWNHVRILEKNAGLLHSLIEVVNLDDFNQTDSVVSYINMAVNKLKTRKSRFGQSSPVISTALVVGGGPSGLSSAAALASLGIHVHIIEKSGSLGGNMKFYNDADIKTSVQKLINEAENNRLIDIHFNSRVTGNTGIPGSFKSIVIDDSGNTETIDYGAVILAAGGNPMQPEVYNLGSHEQILTHFEFASKLDEPEFASQQVKTVAMIQCAGSREEPQNYCSRICCVKTLNNALKLKEIQPDADIYVFYRDIMAYGEHERLYTRARKAGIIFISFNPDKKPELKLESGKPVLKAYDPVLGETIYLEPDWISLAVGLEPASNNNDLAEIFKINLTQDGFIQEADYKWRPLDTGREGIFTCGLAKAPANANEAMSQGKAAAHRAFRLLNRPKVSPQRIMAQVRHTYCSICGMCMDVCPYHARYIDEELGQMMVDPISCQGCGACAAVCPSSATLLGDHEDNGIMNAIEAALQ